VPAWQADPVEAAMPGAAARVAATVDTRTDLDTHVRLWDTAGRHEVDGYAVGLSPDGHRLASANQDGTVHIFDTVDGSDRTVLRGHQGPVFGVAFSPDGGRVATASQDGTIRVWHTDGTTAFTLPGHPGGARTVRYSADGRWLVSTGTDETLRIWKASFGPPATTAVFGPGGTRVATLHADERPACGRARCAGPTHLVLLPPNEGHPVGGRGCRSSRGSGCGRPLPCRGRRPRRRGCGMASLGRDGLSR
jgi:WD40 repeat protein